MSAPPTQDNPFTPLWVAQLATPPILAAVGYFLFADSAGQVEPALVERMAYAPLVVAALVIPALLFRARFREKIARLGQEWRQGRGNEETQASAMTALAIGVALCDLPMLVGFVAYLASGVLTALLVSCAASLALLILYRPDLEPAH
jgi:hypothetical protein